ncbi:MAG: acylneuraminate cytidylyltransferase family protein [Desulfobacteraceae bacterium]|nr:acylneuraminate cytidylyltransferase family protein [Desulfobacteraceae bacterium]
MTTIDKPLCIIPSRGGSKRFPRKNIALLAGKPLLAYAVEAAVASNIFDHVCVSSDDDDILGLARTYGATLALKRPPELATDTAQVKDVCAYLLEDLAGQGQVYTEFAVLLVTNPFRTADDISAAYDIFRRGNANSVISLVPYSHPPQRAVWTPKGYVEPYFGLEYMKQTQLLDPLYRHDGSIIFARSEVFLKEREFYGTKVVPFFMPPERSVDIDSPLDLAWAEFLCNRSDLLCK